MLSIVCCWGGKRLIGEDMTRKRTPDHIIEHRNVFRVNSTESKRARLKREGLLTGIEVNTPTGTTNTPQAMKLKI